MDGNLGRVCMDCGEHKPAEQFRKRGAGLYSYCKPCDSARSKRGYEKRSKARCATATSWQRANPDKAYRYQRRRYLKSYGLSEALYDKMLEAQGGGCAVCGAKYANSRGHKLHVDHSHTTGKVRGLLCQHCNYAVGHLRDDASLAEKLVEYLK